MGSNPQISSQIQLKRSHTVAHFAPTVFETVLETIPLGMQQAHMRPANPCRTHTIICKKSLAFSGLGSFRAVSGVMLESSARTVWLQNTAHTWWNVVNEYPVAPVEPGTVDIACFAPGRYLSGRILEHKGGIEEVTTAVAADGLLRLSTPRIAKDTAVRITPESGRPLCRGER